MNILFLCVGNSSRSQMAEGIARKLLKGRGIVQSAGTEPKLINSLAIKVMQEIDIDISQQKSKSVNTIDPNSVEYVVTLCAEEACPVFLKAAPQLHWPFPDPALIQRTEEEKLQAFRKIRDELLTKIENFIRESL